MVRKQGYTRDSRAQSAFGAMRLACVIASLCAAVVLPMGPVLAQTAPGAGGANIAVTPQAPRVAQVEGFRSAKFGMTQDEVRAAIATDFGVAADAVLGGRNTVERTEVLTLLVPDLLQGSGTAQVTYIFGYTSKTLIQVGVSWGPEIDPAITDAVIAETGDILQAHFLSGGYDPASITLDALVENGLVMFRGADAQGRTAILLMQGALSQSADGSTGISPTGLALLYSVDPDNPDVFAIKDGEF